MGRKVDITAINAALAELDTRIGELRKSGYIIGHQVRLSYPRGTASRNSRSKCYPRLLNQRTGKTQAIAPESVGEIQAAIDRGRELLKLEKERVKLMERLGKSLSRP